VVHSRVRQMGHVSACRLCILAHALHIHRCLHGNIAVSFGADMQITQSGSLPCSMPYISCVSTTVPFTCAHVRESTAANVHIQRPPVLTSSFCLSILAV
jgi:hypothetical protein